MEVEPLRGADLLSRGVLLSGCLVRCDSNRLHLQWVGREDCNETKQIISQLVILQEFINVFYPLMCSEIIVMLQFLTARCHCTDCGKPYQLWNAPGFVVTGMW